MTCSMNNSASVFCRSGSASPQHTDDPMLTAVQGAFVTLHTPDDDLRGCIGHIEGVQPLIETVAQMRLVAGRSRRLLLPRLLV